MSSETTIPGVDAVTPSNFKTWQTPLRQSSLSTCIHCRRKFMFECRWRLFLKQQPFQSASTTGHIVHRLLQVGPEHIDSVDREVQMEINALTARIDAGEDLLGHLAASVNGLTDSLNMAKVMCLLLWERYPRPPHIRTLFREFTIRTMLKLTPPGMPALDIPIEGTLDEGVLDEQASCVYIRDTKTTGRPVEFTLTGYSYSLQCRLYRILIDAWLRSQKETPLVGVTKISDLPPTATGFILDILQKPTIRMCDKDRPFTEYNAILSRGPRKGQMEVRREYAEGTSPVFENYLNRCREWYKEAGSEAASSFSVAYAEAPMPSELADALILGYYLTAQEPIPSLFARDITSDACTAWDRVCLYYPLCSTSEAAWPAIIESKYEQVPPPKIEEEVKDNESTELS